MMEYSRDKTAAPGVSRRRMLALTGALGLMPRAAAAQEEAKPENWACGAARPTYAGFHRLDYHLKDGQPTHVTARMRFDLNSFDWFADKEDARDVAFDPSLKNWSKAVRTEVERRRSALSRVPSDSEREMIGVNIDTLDTLAFLATHGWLDLTLRNPPGRSDTLAPETLTVRFPPLGRLAGLANEWIAIEAWSEGKKVAEWSYKVTDQESSTAGVGPAPYATESEQARVRQLTALLAAGKPLLFRAKAKSDTLFELETPLGYDWQEEYGVVASLIPDARQAAEAKARGVYEDYRAQNPDGGTCEREGCFLTTATVGAVGLADDCWELSTLRRFRDGWLARQPFGAALIAEYYRLAPALVALIDARADARKIWLESWAFGIVPAAMAARLGLNRLALWLYRRMVSSLALRARLPRTAIHHPHLPCSGDGGVAPPRSTITVHHNTREVET